MNSLTPEQKAAFKNLAMVAAFYYGSKVANKLVKWGLFGYLAYQVIQLSKNQSAQNLSGWGMKVDPDLAVDMLFPEMSDETKAYAKIAARNLMQGFMPGVRP